MIDRADAESLALAWVAQLAGSEDVVIDDRLTDEVDLGWVFRFDTRAALDGDDDARLVGTPPLLVDRDGAVHELLTGRPVAEQLGELQLDGEELRARERVLLAHEAISEELARARASGDDDDRTGALTAVEEGLRAEYLDTVPEEAISRCPFTGEVAWYPIDLEGLDGLWWRAEDPVRPEAALPPTVVAVTGAVHLALEPAPQPFTALPGPAVPVVVPAVLEADGIAAVLSTVPVGPHIGYVVTYFADGERDLPAVLTEWGRRPDGPEPSVDADLRRWVLAGKLLWVAPFDPDLVLRRGADGCPYLELEGSTEPQTVPGG